MNKKEVKVLMLCDFACTTGFAQVAHNIVEQLFKDNNIELIWNEYTHPTYNQQFGEFIPYMSILDLLFNEGPNSKNIILK